LFAWDGAAVATGRQGAVGHANPRRCSMSTSDKISNKGEELQGKVKEGVGEATDDKDLKAEGKGDQAKGNLKQAGEKVKDVFKS